MLWGVAHLFATKNVIAGFGELSQNNKQILTMEWLAEGFTLIFIGALIFLITKFYGTADGASVFVIRAATVMLIAMSILSFFTGFRTTIIPIKICPFVKILTAILFFMGRL